MVFMILITFSPLQLLLEAKCYVLKFSLFMLHVLVFLFRPLPPFFTILLFSNSFCFGPQL